MPMHVVLVEPQIANNTGNIIRLCANVGATLHLVEPLGFTLDDASLRRAGMDYREVAEVVRHRSWAEVAASLGGRGEMWAVTGEGSTRYDDVRFGAEPVFVFGCESKGLAPELRASLRSLRVPMRPGNRSLNLANAVAVVAYEAWRQRGFDGAATPPPAAATPTPSFTESLRGRRSD